MSTAFQRGSIQLRKKSIAEAPVQPVIFQGRTYIGKNLMFCDVLVRVSVNQFESGLMNGDICKGLYEIEDDKLIVRRLEDGYEAIVSKENVRIPVWETYQY